MGNYLSEDLLKPTIDLASKTRRWLASLIDYVLYFAICVFVGLYFGEKYTTSHDTVGYRTHGWPALVPWLCWWLLLPVLEGATGQTLGKAIFNIKTVKENGSEASFGNCAARHLFDIIDFAPFFGVVGLLVAAGNNSRQRVGDLVAKTIVVNVQKKS